MELQTLQRAREADGGVVESIHVWSHILACVGVKYSL